MTSFYARIRGRNNNSLLEITIPKRLREEKNLKNGDYVKFTIDEILKNEKDN